LSKATGLHFVSLLGVQK